jgi:hypothetical protein
MTGLSSPWRLVRIGAGVLLVGRVLRNSIGERRDADAANGVLRRP